MANIIVQGKQYNNVPAVNFPKVGGGVATYTEGGGSAITVVQLNANANGTYNAPADTAYNPVVVSVTPTLQSKAVNPSASQQTVSPDSGYDGLSSVTVNAMPIGSATTPSTTISPSVNIGVSNSGLITATAQDYEDITPTVVAGYVSSGTSGRVDVDAYDTYQLPTQSATTITPSTTSQTAVSAGKFTTGAITVDPIPSQYIVPTGTVSITSNGTVDVTQYASASVNVPSVTTSYLGTNPVKIADYATQTVALSNTNFATWTPSTTATDIYASSNAGTAVLDTSNYDYEIIWFFDIGFVYDGTESGARIRRQCLSIRQSIYKSPSNLTYLSNKDYNYNRCATLFTSGLVDYYNSSNALALSYTLSVGIFPSATACTYSSNTSNTPTVTIKTPKIRAVCHNTFLTTTNCAKIDKANTKFTLRGELWRVDKDSAMQGMYRNIVELYNS